MVTWKLRITVFWLVLAVCNPVGMILLMFRPGVVRDLMAGEFLGVDVHSAGVQVNIAIYWLVPLAMACLTLVLEDAANRWANGIVGATAVLSTISSVFGLPGTFGGVQVVALFASVVALLIIWHVWKWPQPGEVTPSRQRQEATHR